MARLRIGLTLANPGDAAVAQAIRDIKDEDLLAWRRNLEALPRSVYVYTDEAARLGGALADIVNDRARPRGTAPAGPGTRA